MIQRVLKASPWPNPDDDVLYRKVMPEDFKALAVPEGATGTVVVEASKWLEGQPMDSGSRRR